jgi:hypothetical protein
MNQIPRGEIGKIQPAVFGEAASHCGDIDLSVGVPFSPKQPRREAQAAPVEREKGALLTEPTRFSRTLGKGASNRQRRGLVERENSVCHSVRD